jgi:Circularly permutated YpsA SLOG family
LDAFARASSGRKVMPVRKIISGGQTGADQGALFAAEDLGIATGGWMPKGYRTETGAYAELAARFALTEHSSDNYGPSTALNVDYADATLIFSNPRSPSSPGYILTRKYCREYMRPMYIHPWNRNHWRGVCAVTRDEDFLRWLEEKQIGVLNVAGSRESRNPGIFQAVREFLVVNLSEGKA